MPELKDLIRESRIKKPLTQEELGKLVGVKKQAISQFEKSGTGISTATIDKIKQLLDIDESKVNSSSDNPPNLPPHLYPAFVSNSMRQSVLRESIPLFDYDLSNGNLSKLIEDYASNIVPSTLFLKTDFKGCDLVIKHRDDAMKGKFSDDELIGIKRVKKDSIIPGKIYVVVLEEYVLERYLYYDKTNKKYRLKPHNTEVEEEFELSEDEVLETWVVKAHAPEQKISKLI